MGSMGASQIRTEMTKLEQALVNLVGVKPAYIRPPYLDTGGQFLPTMKEMNYRVVTNDIDTGDWNNQSPQQAQQQFQRAGAGGMGHIPLMHEVYPGTVNTLTPWLINWAKQNNLKLVTVGEWLTSSSVSSEHLANNVVSLQPSASVMLRTCTSLETLPSSQALITARNEGNLDILRSWWLQIWRDRQQHSNWTSSRTAYRACEIKRLLLVKADV